MEFIDFYVSFCYNFYVLSEVQALDFLISTFFVFLGKDNHFYNLLRKLNENHNIGIWYCNTP